MTQINQKQKIEIEIADTSGIVEKIGCNAKIIKIEGKKTSISTLATKAALTAVENKIPTVSILAKKADCNTKITEIEKKLTDHNHDKYIAPPEFNTLAADVFNARLAEKNLITKTNFGAKLSNLNKNITSDKTKHLLIENEFKKLISLVQFVSEEKVILEKMAHKIIQYFYQ